MYGFKILMDRALFVSEAYYLSYSHIIVVSCTHEMTQPLPACVADYAGQSAALPT